jgi:predicted phosphohydrolase
VSIYALADLHLSFAANKPMDVFGGNWGNYTEKIETNWRNSISDDDLVIIPGDVSWATYLDDAVEDFRFINGLPGKKVIIKGNHDYWWTTLSKMEKFLEENQFNTIKILNNTAVEFENAAICGTRGWWYKEEQNNDDDKILDRERKRLVLALEAAVKLKKERIIVGIHYPPIDADSPNCDFFEIMKQYNVDTCVYGHLHSYAHKNAVTGVLDGIKLKLVSGDFVDFAPVLV